MTDEQAPQGPVVLTRVSGMHQADMIVGLLHGEGIVAMVGGGYATSMAPHLQQAINPRGIEVLVPADRVAEARSLLEDGGLLSAQPGQKDVQAPAEGDEDDTEDTDEPSADDMARRAALAAVFGLISIVLLPMAWWLLIRAISEAERQPPDNPARYRVMMTVAFVFAVLGPFLLSLLLALNVAA
jgi:hypothetical protein